MADAGSQSSFRRFFLYVLVAVPIAAVIFAITAAMQSGSPPKVAFDMKLKVYGEDFRAGGTAYLEDDGFSFESDRLSFTGTVNGDDVKITGTVTKGDRSQTRQFGTSGHLADNQMSATLNGDRGSRLGTMKLELLNR
jgi:hypothetical protein